MIKASIFLGLTLFISSLLALEATAEQQLIRPENQHQWDAVGRVNYGGLNPDAICTGALIAPDLVLTAAHCVLNLRDASPEALNELIFVAGWNKDKHAAAGRAKAVTFDPDHEFATLTLANIPTDIAVITLQKPMNVAPLQIAPLPQTGTKLGFVAYSTLRRDVPTLTTGCTADIQGGGLFVLDCNVISGNSGAPVLDLTSDTPRIVGVISARAPNQAFAAAPPPWVRSLIVARTAK